LVFGRRMRAERLRRNWRLEDLAAHAAGRGLTLHPSAYSKIEVGTRGIPLGEAAVIADTFGIPLQFMITEVDVTGIERQLAEARATLADASTRSDQELERAAQAWNLVRLYETELARQRAGTEGENT
jgi:transcriptional regulator with XRE-family HTH domain